MAVSVLVAYASRHGATAGIAERIAERLRAAGLAVDALPVKAVRDPEAYDAFVVGSAVYMFHWLGDARGFVRGHARLLASRPTWLFSSGPIDTKPSPDGLDPLVSARAKEIGELRALVDARDERMFYGAWSASYRPKGLVEQFVLRLPAARTTFPDADLRDWPEIDAWADSIARALAPRPTMAVATPG